MGSSDRLEQGFGQSRSKNQVAGRWGEAAGARLPVLLLRPLGSWGAGRCAVGLGMSELVLIHRSTAARAAPTERTEGVQALPRPSPHAHRSPTAWVSLPKAIPPRGQPLPLPAFLS